MDLCPHLGVLGDAADDSPKEVKHRRLHEELVVLLGRVVLLDVNVALLVVVVPPEDQPLLLLELDEGDAADVQVVVIAVPEPFPAFQDVSLEQVEADAVLENNLSDRGDAPRRVKDVARRHQEGLQLAPPRHRVHVLHQLVHNHRRTNVPRNQNLEQTAEVILKVNLDFDLLMMRKFHYHLFLLGHLQRLVFSY